MKKSGECLKNGKIQKKLTMVNLVQGVSCNVKTFHNFQKVKGNCHR